MKKNLIIAVLVLCTACTKAVVKEKPANGLAPTQDRDISLMLQSLSAINENSPSSYDLEFIVDGSLKSKKYKSIGNASFDRNSDRFYIVFLDFIFKSPVTMIFQDGKDISLYFPADRKLFRENRATISFANYTGVDLDFTVVYDLVTGKVPLIPGYSIREGYRTADGKTSYLILENSDYFQTISFAGSEPDRIKFVQKKNREEVEVYLRKKTVKDGTSFFRNITIVMKKSDTRVDITFRGIKLNTPVKVKTVGDVKIPREVKIITM